MERIKSYMRLSVPDRLYKDYGVKFELSEDDILRLKKCDSVGVKTLSTIRQLHLQSPNLIDHRDEEVKDIIRCIILLRYTVNDSHKISRILDDATKNIEFVTLRKLLIILSKQNETTFKYALNVLDFSSSCKHNCNQIYKMLNNIADPEIR